MMCAWQELLHVLPVWLRAQAEAHRDKLQELRLRLGKPPELITEGESAVLERAVTGEDLNFAVNTASRYSPWAAATVAQGYLTCAGGHRIGLCGEAVVKGGVFQGIRNLRSLCIRVARDFPGIARGLPEQGSVLILGKPGAGKTTLLRDLIRQRSGRGSVAVVDERGELFPEGFDSGPRTDIMFGCSKETGIPLAIRTMGPGTVAVDEITDRADTEALCQAGGCGVTLLATAHGEAMEDLRCRSVYRPLLEQGLFQTVVILQPDKSWRTERMCI